MKSFKTLKAFESFIRRNGTPDYVKVAGVTYTMDEYDMSGKEITYGNKRTKTMLLVHTSNRYGTTKFEDAEVEQISDGWFRNDIAYED